MYHREISTCCRCEMKFTTFALTNISHLHSKYFIAKRFHLTQSNFVATQRVAICPWHSWIARQTPTLKVEGSNPFGQAKNRQASSEACRFLLFHSSLLTLNLRSISKQTAIFIAKVEKKTILCYNIVWANILL